MADQGHKDDAERYGPMDMTLSLAGMWIQGPWTSHTASYTAGLAGWHTSEGPTFSHYQGSEGSGHTVQMGARTTQ
eukprot:3407886-Prorocentrum_lima.AAC.1